MRSDETWMLFPTPKGDTVISALAKRERPVSVPPGSPGWKLPSLEKALSLLVALAALPPTTIGLLANELSTASPAPIEGPAPVAVPEPAKPSWSFGGYLYAYFVPDSRDYVQPTFTADRDWLHLEGRYNYEDLETGSAWIGYNLGGGNTVTWEITPMVGGVFGATTGFAPGYKGSVGWWRLELYSEGEFLCDPGDWSASYFYNWSELTLAPVSWFRFGLVTQRTRAYESNRDIQRGLLVGFTYRRAGLTASVFNLDESQPMVALAVSLEL